MASPVADQPIPVTVVNGFGAGDAFGGALEVLRLIEVTGRA
jgi:sugar/nucleoside kinase (ribokinase family)